MDSREHFTFGTKDLNWNGRQRNLSRVLFQSTSSSSRLTVKTISGIFTNSFVFASLVVITYSLDKVSMFKVKIVQFFYVTYLAKETTESAK